MDYDDEDLLCFFLEHLKKYLYAHKCLFVRMDPYVEYQPHTPDGGVIGGAWKNDHLIEIFQRYGFEHQGFRTKNDNNYEPRWMSVISLEGKDETAVLKQMHGQTRRNIKFVERNGIKTRELAYDELDRLYTLVNMTGDRKHFENPTLAYYQSFYTAFKEHKISLPSNLIAKKRGKQPVPDSTLLNRPLKMIIYVDPKDCTDCKLLALMPYHMFILENATNTNFGVIFILHTPNMEEAEVILKEINFPHTVFYDLNGDFERLNPHLPQDDVFHTFLMNESNDVLLVGNPTHNEALKELYLKAIKYVDE